VSPGNTCEAISSAARSIAVFGSAINIAPVSNAHHQDHERSIMNLINNAVIANANAPEIIAFEFLAARRPGITGQSAHRCHEARGQFLVAKFA
jgi:hypothetical protein